MQRVAARAAAVGWPQVDGALLQAARQAAEPRRGHGSGAAARRPPLPLRVRPTLRALARTPRSPHIRTTPHLPRSAQPRRKRSPQSPPCLPPPRKMVSARVPDSAPPAHTQHRGAGHHVQGHAAGVRVPLGARHGLRAAAAHAGRRRRARRVGARRAARGPAQGRRLPCAAAAGRRSSQGRRGHGQRQRRRHIFLVIRTGAGA